MTDSPRQRRYRAREQQILALARKIAEEEGWPAVTTRRLAQEIDHSQPVIYQHFGSREQLIRAVTVQGFAELAALVRDIAEAGRPALESLCRAYLDFGTRNPALYEAMFTRPTELPFAQSDTPAELRDSFEVLADAVAREANFSDDDDVAALTELFWATCHGLTSLHSAGRIPEHHLDHQIRRISSMIRGD
ncbi:TetR/AcrR family transcriptional regulator [Nesterenkonia muleiensis]|uniref:TetR/AcrR family transcriptional regulator n=1 Tax=Nesterenkonia muleiensis TaxID=2282648 RepID=UPI000E751CE6|nr:TetR/AcrR family transcriptional regulator [Nesterenkonia muleiensis]